MRFQYVYLLSLFSIVTTIYLSAQFTESRKKRAPSMNTLKESCCKELGQFLHESAELLCTVGSLQKKSLSAIEEYANGDKAGWCATASRDTLSDCQKRLARLHAKMESFTQECTELMRAMERA